MAQRSALAHCALGAELVCSLICGPAPDLHSSSSGLHFTYAWPISMCSPSVSFSTELQTQTYSYSSVLPLECSQYTRGKHTATSLKCGSDHVTFLLNTSSWIPRTSGYASAGVTTPHYFSPPKSTPYQIFFFNKQHQNHYLCSDQSFLTHLFISSFNLFMSPLIHLERKFHL